ncbi:hypothetical protein [Gloeobacter kilaueensis]|nr:hypothetical protein [Gloeobacter kilaueensis]
MLSNFHDEERAMKGAWIGGFALALLLAGGAIGAEDKGSAAERQAVETLVAAYSTAASAAADGDFEQAREAFQNAQALRDFHRDKIMASSLVAAREMTEADTTAERVLASLTHPNTSVANLFDLMQRKMEAVYATLPSPPATSSTEAIKQVRQQFDAALIELNEREFPQALEFVERGASALEANHSLLGDADYTRLNTSVEAARSALKNQQFRAARRALDEILAALNK